MIPRFLPILNLVGCVLVTGVILAQWRKEQQLGNQVKAISQELVASHDQTAEAEKRATALEGDVAQLKESIEATAAANRLAEAENVRVTTEHHEKMNALITAAEGQAQTWQAAIAERDAKIKELGSSLSATRTRLNEAIAKLKEAGAR